MSITQAHIILESVDMVDFEDREEAMFTLAQAELDTDELEEEYFSF
jgi:hypothetical protein